MKINPITHSTWLSLSKVEREQYGPEVWEVYDHDRNHWQPATQSEECSRGKFESFFRTVRYVHYRKPEKQTDINQERRLNKMAKDTTRISNQHHEIIKASQYLICPAWVIHLAKYKVGNNRQNVYDWVSANTHIWKPLI